MIKTEETIQNPNRWKAICGPGFFLQAYQFMRQSNYTILMMIIVSVNKYKMSGKRSWKQIGSLCSTQLNKTPKVCLGTSINFLCRKMNCMCMPSRWSSCGKLLLSKPWSFTKFPDGKHQEKTNWWPKSPRDCRGSTIKWSRPTTQVFLLPRKPKKIHSANWRRRTYHNWAPTTRSLLSTGW